MAWAEFRPRAVSISVIPSSYSCRVSRPRSYMIFDIETVPDDTMWDPPDGQGGQEVTFPPAYAHMPIVLAWLWLDESYGMKEIRVISSEGGEGAGERFLLAEFSNFVEQNRPALVTYNGRAFDLPVIALRSLRHGVAMPWYYQDNGRHYRYNLEDHIDLCDWLADRGATRSGSLDALAKLIGLPGKLGMDGSHVEGLYRSGHIDDIQRYCLADVAQTAILFLRFRLLQGLIDRDEYRSMVTALTEQLSAEPRLCIFMQAVDGDRLLAA